MVEYNSVCKYVCVCIDKLGKLSDMITYSGFRGARVHASHIYVQCTCSVRTLQCRASDSVVNLERGRVSDHAR